MQSVEEHMRRPSIDTYFIFRSTQKCFEVHAYAKLAYNTPRLNRLNIVKIINPKMSRILELNMEAKWIPK